MADIPETSPVSSVESDNYRHIEQFARGIQESLSFDSSALAPEHKYVAWLDMMGAGRLMNTSLEKTANAIARLHLAVELSRADTGFSDDLLPMNDGLFVISANKVAVMRLVQQALVYLSARFIATPVPQDRFLIRGAIAYGPVITGAELSKGFGTKKLRDNSGFVKSVYFGAPVVQAFYQERTTPPFGIGIHESARAFAPTDTRPFRTNIWLWWHKNDDGSLPKNGPALTALRELMKIRLAEYFEWLKETRVFNELSNEKIDELSTAANQYFSAK
jgi:hypothetical protein